MKFPKKNIDITAYYDEVKVLLGDNECAIFIDTNIISQLYRLNDEARLDFYKWVVSCGDRFHIPVWVIHEYSDKIYKKQTSDYLSELSKIKTCSKELCNISTFVKGYVGESLLQGSAYQGEVQKLKDDIDDAIDSLQKIGTAINNNINKHQQTVHNEIVKHLECRVLNSDIYSIVANSENIYRQRSIHRISPGYLDGKKEENCAGDYIIWMEILQFCKNKNIKKAILITRDMKSDFTYFPSNQIIACGRLAKETESIRLAKNSLVYEFYTHTQSDKFYVIDFKTFVKIYAQQYTQLALSFQLATAEEEKEKAETEKLESIQIEDLNIEHKNTELHKGEKGAEINNAIQQVNYLGIAIADEQYDDEANIGYMDEYITQLKTYNWYIQNPAIDELTKLQKIDIQDTIENRSSIFVLGRNLVQAAEGSSGNAIMFMENIHKYIRYWDDVFKKSLIDGMLFEVFFDSKGQIRPKEFKAQFFENIITNIKYLNLASPYDFINEKILGVNSRFVPTVGDDKQYSFEFTIGLDGKTIKLECNGEDISETFKRSWDVNFASSDNIQGALSMYYGILSTNIQVLGIDEELKEVKYIEEPWDLPF